MKQSNAIPRWGQWASGISLLIVAMTAAAISLAVNFQAGLVVHIAIAAMLGLSDVGKILIPVVCQAIGWSLQSRATYAVASVTSVVCAFIFMGAMFDAQHAKTVNQTVLTANADQQIRDLRQSLASTRQMASEEAKRGGCGPKCQSLLAEASKKQTALSEALEAREAMPTKAAVPSQDRAFLLTLLGLAVMELLSHMAGAAASMISSAMRKTSAENAPKQTKKVKNPKSANKKPVAPKPNWTKIEAYTPRLTKKGAIDRRTRAGRALKRAANANVLA